MITTTTGVSLSPSLACAVLAAAAAALPLVVVAMRLALRRVLALDLELGRGKPGMRRSGAARSSFPRRGDPAGDAPAPPYLADPSSDERIIGGNPESLPPPRGPAVTTLTFRAYAPPSVDGEIPKVDLYGAMQFVRTGKVRTFAPMGARRLLVIDFREMTLAVYAPRRRGVSAEGGGSPYLNGRGRPRAPSSAAAAQSPSGLDSSRSGIRISSMKIDLGEVGEGGPDEAEAEAEGGEEVWDPRNFKRVPARLLCLDDIVSISAVPPRRGGVIEIVSRSGGLHSRTLDGCESALEAMARPSSPKKQYRGKRSRPAEGHLLPCGEIEDGGKSNESEYYAAVVGGDSVSGDLVADPCSEEFTFRSPGDAAEFQRILVSLRCVGDEVSHLFEALEAIPPSPSSLSPAEPPGDGPGSSKDEEAAARAAFISPGVAPEDARGCLDEIPVLRRGLRRLQRLERAQDDEEIGFDNILEESSELAHAKGQCHRLGLVDFFRLFLPPLPSGNTPPFMIVPCFSPSAKSESTYLGEDEVMRTRGIEWHYRHLALVAALQRLVGRAALHIRAYAWAKVIALDGWRMHGLDDCDEDDHVQIAKGLSDMGEFQSPYNGETIGENGLQRSNSEAPHPPNRFHRGYSCIGSWYALRSAPLEEELLDGSGEGRACLRPESDPLQCIPSIRAVVRKYPYAHFVVFSHFNARKNFAVYYLLVRSLPVGADKWFDDTMQQFVRSSSKERDLRLGISMELEPAKTSSLLTKLAFRALRALCNELTRVAIEASPKKEGNGQTVLISEYLMLSLASFWHYGGSLADKREELPANYVGINSQLCLGKFPSHVGRLILWSAGLFLQRRQASTAVLKLGNFSDRAIASIDIASTIKKIIQDSSSEEKALTTDKQTMFGTTDDADMISEAAGNCSNGSDEMYRNEIDTVLEVLDGMTIPLRRRDKTRGEHNQDNRGEIITTKPILSLITRSDIERHLVACAQEENAIKATVVRIVESAAWRGLMFPIDTRTCRIELQSGQFFHHGHDKQGCPIFYFRNMLLGPWRSDIHSSTLAVLHRLETYLSRHLQPNVKITVIAFMGHPSELVKAKGKNQADYADRRQTQIRSKSVVGADPRLDPHEGYHSHVYPVLVHLLSDLVPRHYPGRIARVLVLPAGQKKLRVRSYFSSMPKHLNVTILSSISDLKKYVGRNELPLFAGGNAMVAPESFHVTGF